MSRKPVLVITGLALGLAVFIVLLSFEPESLVANDVFFYGVLAVLLAGLCLQIARRSAGKRRTTEKTYAVLLAILAFQFVIGDRETISSIIFAGGSLIVLVGLAYEFRRGGDDFR